MPSKNMSLVKAKASKNDEFYTQLSDIENELKHYTKHFKNKVVYCNCDDPKSSNFYRYFVNNFEILKLKTLLCTHYQPQQQNLFGTKKIIPATCTAMYARYRTVKHDLVGDGDFRSAECKTILDTADIVVTNPPFSLFREYVAQLIQYKKKFIIIGNQNAITYKETFKLIKENKIWYGNHVGDMKFKVPSNYEPRKVRYWQDENGQKWRSLGTICWFTNLDIAKRHEDLILYKKYNKTEFPKYDNYNAININKTKDIPVDYKEAMGVPITFFDKYNPDQFEIIGMDQSIMKELTGRSTRFILDGKILYARIVIRHIKPNLHNNI